MQPDKSQIHIDVVLTAFAQRYIQSPGNFIAGRVFPIVPVDKSSDKYRTWSKGFWFRDEAKLRVPGAHAPLVGYELSTDTYTCDEFWIGSPIHEQQRRDGDSDINLDNAATELVAQKLLIRREKQWMSDFFATSKWATDKAVSSKWNDKSNSDPIGDIETGKATILAATGFMPNSLTVSFPVWQALKSHPDIEGRMGIGGSTKETRVVTREAVAAILELDALHVALGVEATSAEGATLTMAAIAGKHALLCYVPATASKEIPTSGVTFGLRQQGATAGDLAGVAIRRKRDDLGDTDIIEGLLAWDNKIPGADLGYFFNSVVD